MLQATDVTFGYDERKPVVRRVSLSIPARGVVGILGPNGSGKTTLLRLLAGTRHPQAGTVTLDGKPLKAMSRVALARRMAVVPQETQLAFDYTVGEVAMMGRYAHLGPFEIEGPADVDIVDEALASTGTLAFKDRLFATLSGGEKQRVVIASALAQIFRLKPEATNPESAGSRLKPEATSPESAGSRLKPEATRTSGGFRLQPEESGYLLLDEPTASLDLGYQLDVAALLQKLHEERGVTIVVSTHDLALAGALCRRALLIRDGVVLAEGTTDETLTAENVRRLYGVDVDVVQHASGRRVLVPTGRSDRG